MVLILHILIALTSVFYTGFVYLFPTQKRFKVAYGFVGMTLLTGTYLVIVSSAHLVSACFSGLIYLGLVGFGLTFAHRRLAAAESAKKSE